MNDASELTEIVAVLTLMMAEMESKAFEHETFGELTMRQVFYLDKILHMESPTFSEIAGLLNISKPSVTAIVGTLIRKGFVEKVQDGDDKRVYHVVCTQKVIAFDQLHQQIHQRMVDTLLTGLDENEVKSLTDILRKAMKT